VRRPFDSDAVLDTCRSWKYRMMLCLAVSANYKFVILITIILVLANYSGLYINPAAVPGRVALSFLSFLMVLNQMKAVFEMLPPIAVIERCVSER